MKIKAFAMRFGNAFPILPRILQFWTIRLCQIEKDFLELHQDVRSTLRSTGHESTSTTKILQDLYDKGVKSGKIVPGSMTIDDMANMAMTAIRTHLPELRKEGEATNILAQGALGTQEFIANLQSKSHQYADLKTTFCTMITDVKNGLQAVPVREKEAIDARKRLNGISAYRCQKRI